MLHHPGGGLRVPPACNDPCRPADRYTPGQLRNGGRPCCGTARRAAPRNARHHRDQRPVQLARCQRRLPGARLTAVAGPSGAGKTALVRECLTPAAQAVLRGQRSPGTSAAWAWAGIRQVVQIDASPIGQNARATPATLLRRVRPDPPRFRRVRVRPVKALEARALLVQHPRRPAPHLPRPGPPACAPSTSPRWSAYSTNC